MSRASDMMAFLDQIEEPIATFTGMKASLVDKGWSPLAAEQLVIEMFKASQVPEQRRRR